jgi:hypothetical protein
MAVQAATLVKWAKALVELGSTAKDLKDMVDEPGTDFGKVELTITATETEFALVWTGGGFDLDHTGALEGSTSVVDTDNNGNTISKLVWEWSLNVLEDAGHHIDGLVISGWVLHKWQPHEVDIVQTEAVNFNMSVNADNTERKEVVGSNDDFTLNIDGVDPATNTVIHPAYDAPEPETLPPGAPHIDQITKQRITATIHVGSHGADFTSYTFMLNVRHKESE